MAARGDFVATSFAALAADYPAPKHGDFVISDFRFHTGEVMREFDERLAAPPPLDANDFIYQWQASHDYDASAGLSGIEATLLAINSADDERNPPETGVTLAAIKQLNNGSLHLIPASVETRGHATTGNAKLYQQQIRELLLSASARAM